jgi:3'-5' exonuclease
VKTSNILFLDIETVSEYKSYDDCPLVFQELWSKKARSILKSLEDPTPEEIAESYSSRAGIYAEFSKIICLSLGVVNDSGTMRIKSFSGENENKLLTEFATMMEKSFNDINRFSICGHNIKEFDIPVICRRMVKHGMKLPILIDITGKKPWETQHLKDTMDMWRFGDFKSYTSLNLLTAVLGIPSPKDDIDGSMVGQVYWQDNQLDRIVTYCEKDVVTVAKVFFRLSGIHDFEIKKIEKA